MGGVLIAGAAISEVGHLSSGPLTLVAAGAGWWWLNRRRGRPQAALPSDAAGWLQRCTGLLEQFERLDPDAEAAQQQRRERLEHWQRESGRRSLSLAVVGEPSLLGAGTERLAAALAGSRSLRLHVGHRQPAASEHWQWSRTFLDCDALLYVAPAPLRAADLRWLTALPIDQPAWVLLPLQPGVDPSRCEAELSSQLGSAVTARLLLWDDQRSSLDQVLAPLGERLRQSPQQLIEATRLRALKALHNDWQLELEGWRRQRFLGLQQRSQWLVAASVVASPLPALDLVVVVLGNGLMLQEMAELWDCDWSVRDLQAAATELAAAAIALGVAEWSSQTLLGLMKLHGATWLVGSALQALSAAYLTRVVSRAMADVMALSVGVEAPDLARIKREAPLLVARASEAEKLDWSAFLGQAREWIQQQALPA